MNESESFSTLHAATPAEHSGDDSVSVPSSSGSTRRRPRLRLVSLFWLQFFLSPLFLSPLSQRVSGMSSAEMNLLLFVIAPMFYSATLAWFTSINSPLRFPWATDRFRQLQLMSRGAFFGAVFGAFGFLPYALDATVDLVREHDPTLPVTPWMLVLEPLLMIGVIGFFAAFFSLFGMLGGGILALVSNEPAGN